MRKFLYGVICITFLGFLTACGGGGDDQADQDTAPTEEQDTTEDQGTTDDQGTDNEGAPTADAGEADAKYQQSCSQCHGSDLRSGGAPDLDKIGSKYSKDEIAGIIENGKGNMPGGLLKGEDAEAVASWLAEKK